MNNILKNISAAHLRRAASIRDQIEKLEKEFTGLLGIPEALTVGGIQRRHRRVTATVREKISTAAKARWANGKSGKV